MVCTCVFVYVCLYVCMCIYVNWRCARCSSPTFWVLEWLHATIPSTHRVVFVQFGRIQDFVFKNLVKRTQNVGEEIWLASHMNVYTCISMHAYTLDIGSSHVNLHTCIYIYIYMHTYTIDIVSNFYSYVCTCTYKSTAYIRTHKKSRREKKI